MRFGYDGQTEEMMNYQQRDFAVCLTFINDVVKRGECYENVTRSTRWIGWIDGGDRRHQLSIHNAS
jgi:hypothetical protein